MLNENENLPYLRIIEMMYAIILRHQRYVLPLFNQKLKSILNDDDELQTFLYAMG